MTDDPLRLRVLKGLCGAFERDLRGVSTGSWIDLRYTQPEGDQPPRAWQDGDPDPLFAVFRGRDTYGDTDPLPLLSVLEVPIPLDQRDVPGDSEFSSGGWELVIQGFCSDDPVHPTDPGHYFMADVKRVLAREKRKAYEEKPENGIFGLGNSVIGLRIGPGVVRPPDEVSAVAYFWLTITLEMVEDLSNPFED